MTGHQGNHGEDVKELYYYLDSTPTHSYMKFLYKYPQCAFPYEELVRENVNRDRNVPEFELLDTDAFDEDRYWDVFMEVRIQAGFMRIYADVASSTPKMSKIPTAFTSESPHTIAGPILPLCMLFHSFGSLTLGPGLRTRLPSPLCRRVARESSKLFTPSSGSTTCTAFLLPLL